MQRSLMYLSKECKVAVSDAKIVFVLTYETKIWFSARNFYTTTSRQYYDFFFLKTPFKKNKKDEILNN